CRSPPRPLHHDTTTNRPTLPESPTNTHHDTQLAIGIAKCLYSWPVNPPRNPTGTNTAHSTSTIAIIGAVTSSMALLAASLDEQHSSFMWRSTFSTTTMASSTTMPMASTMPNSVRVLMENPRACMPAKAPMRETGTA